MPAWAFQKNRVLPEFVAKLKDFQVPHAGTVQNYSGRLQCHLHGEERVIVDRESTKRATGCPPAHFWGVKHMDGGQIVFQVISLSISIGGATMGYIAYRRSGEMKALDLRIELKKLLQSIRATVDGLPPLLIEAQRSRNNVASTGRGNGGVILAWNTRCTADMAASKALQDEIPSIDVDYSKFTPAELERKPIDANALNLRALSLADRYRASLAEDDNSRNQIAADIRAHFGRP